MPKQEIRYICEVCGAKYLKKNKAIECEKGHYKVVEVKSVNYSLTDDKKEFPESVNLLFKNEKGMEKNIVYYRKK